MRFTWILYCSRGSGASYENSSLVDVGSIISPRVGGGEIRRQFKDDLKDRFKMKDFRKTDYRDAYILWKVYETAIAKGNLRNWFKLITIIDVELKPILMLEKMYGRWLRNTCQYAALGVDMNAYVDLFKDRLEGVRRRIIVKAKEVWPRFMDIAERLGISEDDLGGLTGLAGTLTYLGWPLRKPSIQKAVHYFGPYRPSKEDILKFMERTGKRFQKHYSGSARRYLNMLMTTILAKEGRYPPKAKDEKETLKRLIKMLKDLEPAEGSRRGEDHTIPRLGSISPRRALRACIRGFYLYWRGCVVAKPPRPLLLSPLFLLGYFMPTMSSSGLLNTVFLRATVERS
ncbi:hypothetical protein DRO64_03795 [Candidatus Bathyarchaeota archaeon]|nr:MAG: hypothetical protein DRO64_03795 [Candidatus Bathyarchaeota archaeon]